ncbi:MAG: DUF4199 domain-containing protein [Alloprevotella sp.]|nr:DUF4199 domain-containing protein [Alloprevotella sp.]
MMKTDTPDLFRQSNAFAMQNGLVLGAWGLASLALYVVAFSRPLLAYPAQLMLVLSVFLAAALTLRFRRRVAPVGAFPFGRAYVHTLLSGLYASVWIALGVYAYFRFGNATALFDAWQLSAQTPEVADVIAQMEDAGSFDDIYAATGSENFTGLIDVLRAVSPASYAGMVISWTLLTAPVISLFIALATMRRPRATR